MPREHTARSRRQRDTKKLQFKDYFVMRSQNRLQFVQRSSYAEQTTNNEELVSVEQEMNAQK